MRILLLLVGAGLIQAQEYDLLLKGGHVIDPANHVSAVRDVAIAAGKILAVAENIPAASANKTVDVSQFYITPGLVDTPQPRHDHERFARLTAGRSECLG